MAEESVATDEILAAPFTLYIGALKTAFPALSAEPAEAWTMIGKLGDKNYSDAGVTVTVGQTLEYFNGAGSTHKRKAWRAEEDFQVSLELADLRPKQWALLLDEATVTTEAGTKTQSFKFSRGATVKKFAALLRGISPLDETKKAQFQIPACVQAGNFAPKLTKKGGPALLAIQLETLEVEENALPELIAEE